MERLKEIFSGEAIAFEEFSRRLKARPDIAGEYTSAKERDQLKVQLEAERAAREKDSADFAAQLSAARRELLIDLELTKAGAKSIRAAKALIDNNAVLLEGGVLSGMEAELERIAGECPFLFGAGAGGNPPAPAGGKTAPPPDESERWRAEAGLV